MKTILRLVVLCLVLAGVSVVQAQEITAIVYDLGDAIITDSVLDDLEIPLRLQGVLALPTEEGAHPLVVILHGRHGICNGDTGNPFPCPDAEIRHDQGFSYLVEGLAKRGYVAVALNINAAMTTYFGSGDINTRAQQIFDMHMDALTAAANGEANDFGVELAGKIDFSQIALIGHSSGGGAALNIARNMDDTPFALLLVAAAYNSIGVEGLYRTPEELFAAYATASDLPVATILPDCDRDQIQFTTQFAYEAARFDSNRSALAASVRLFHADHNQFNTQLTGEGRDQYPPCFGETGTLLPPEDQQSFLLNYTADFFDLALGRAEPNAAFDVTQAAPTELYGLLVETNLLAPAEDRLVVVYPRSSIFGDILLNDLNGRLTPDGIGVSFCAPGVVCYAGITAAGRFGHLRLDYTRYSRVKEIRLEIPESLADVSGYAVLHLRAVPDYLSIHNSPEEAQAFGITLVDRNSGGARVDVSDLSSLTIPEPAEFVGYDPFLLYPASIRIPLSEFANVDLTALAQVVVHFDVVGSGTLLVADLEFVR